MYIRYMIYHLHLASHLPYCVCVCVIHTVYTICAYYVYSHHITVLFITDNSYTVKNKLSLCVIHIPSESLVVLSVRLTNGRFKQFHM